METVLRKIKEPVLRKRAEQLANKFNMGKSEVTKLKKEKGYEVRGVKSNVWFFIYPSGHISYSGYITGDEPIQ